MITLLWAGRVLLHSALALGALVKSEISRKVSVSVGAAMFMGAMGLQSGFPYWAFVALFMLTLTQWKAVAPPSGESPPDLRELAPKRGVLQNLWLGLMALAGGGIAVAWYAEQYYLWSAAAVMVLMILFLALAALWPGKLEPAGPPN